MFRSRALLLRRALPLPQLDSSDPCLHSINSLLGACRAWGSSTSCVQQPQPQRPQSNSSTICTAEEAEIPVRQQRRTAKSDAPHDHALLAGKLQRTLKARIQKLQGSECTQAIKQPHISADQPGTRSARWVYVPVAKLKAQDTCDGVWDMLSNIPPQDILVSILSAALDHMVAISKQQGYQQTHKSLSATEQLLATAENQLGSMDSWGMVAFIRCAATFKGVLQPGGLSAWQQELLQRPELVEQLTQQGLANTLLSLGTLAESDPQLARVLDVQLAGQLLQYAVQFAHVSTVHAALLARQAANVLYGTALLGIQPDTVQVAALFSAVQRGVRGLGQEGVTQVLLASQKFIDKAYVLRQEHGLGPRRPELIPYTIYYPGNKLMGLLLERAHELIQHQQLSLRAASQILGSCGSLGYLPSNLAFKQLLSVLETGDLNCTGASATLMGCARLGVMSPAGVVEACWRALMRDGAQDNQATANIAWALTLLGACTSRMWEILTSSLLANMSTLSPLELRQWHQAYLLIKLQHFHGVACPPELLERSLAAHQAGLARPAIPTYFEWALARAVQQLAEGQQVRVEHLVPDPDEQGGLRVDLALPGLKLAVEADGPYHFLRNVEPPQQTGLSKARDQLLRGWGWHLFVVPAYVWDELHANNGSR